MLREEVAVIVFRSNIGHPPAKKTLWVFGAGASRDLGFPLSSDFFEKSISLITRRFKNPCAFIFQCGDVKKADGTKASECDGKRVRKEPAFALDQVDMWQFLMPKGARQIAALHELIVEWKKLRCLLAEAGLPLPASEVLKRYPETLIEEIGKLPNGSDRAMRAKMHAVECVRRIYFHTLSHFNDAARLNRRRRPWTSQYEKLVRSIYPGEGEHRFLSFNYDTILDEALFKHSYQSWAYDGIPVSAINGYPVGKGAEAELFYIKPHGSLNFAVCPKCKRAQIRWFWQVQPRGVNQPTAYSRSCVICKNVSSVTDLVVPPVYDKKVIQRSRPAMETALAWADNIVIVGFSFPEQDGYVVECMRKGLQKNKHRLISIHLVSKDGKESEKLRANLLERKGLEILQCGRFNVVATKLAGFNAVTFGAGDE